MIHHAAKVTALLLTLLCVACQPIITPRLETTPGSSPTALPIPEPMSPPVTRILFIGDSLSGWSIGLDAYVRGMAASSDPPIALETDTVFIGSATLKTQWEQGRALDEIRDGDWQLIVIQEDLAMSAPNDAYFDQAVANVHDYARQFAAEIDQVDGQVIFYANQEYGYPLHKSVEDFHAANVEIATELGVRVAPVGLAWARVRAMNPDLVLYEGDRIHAAAAGMYLTAAVLYATIYERSPDGLRWLPTDQLPEDTKWDDLRRQLTIVPETRDMLQRIAWEIVQENQ